MKIFYNANTKLNCIFIQKRKTDFTWHLSHVDFLALTTKILVRYTLFSVAFPVL